MLVPLSRHVGPVGFVVGVDADARHLTAVRALVQNERLGNVEILKRNVSDTGLPREAFDFVYVRLASTSSDHPETLLAEAVALTRPGGVVAIQCSAWLAGRRARSIEVWGRKQEAVTRARARTVYPLTER
jgi:SAM-dependent methyltransferase